jgi:hypothetical protein
LQYLNARYYDPELSLFLQPDWFEVTKAGVGTNRFSYSFNDPVNLSDPNGNVVPLVVGGVCALGGCEAVAAFFAAGAVVVTAEVATGAIKDGAVNGNGALATTAEELAKTVAGIGHNGGPPLDDGQPPDSEPPQGPSPEEAAAGILAIGTGAMLIPGETVHGAERGVERGIPGLVQGDALMSQDSISVPSWNDTTVVYNPGNGVTVIVSNATGNVVTSYRGKPSGDLGREIQ